MRYAPRFAKDEDEARVVHADRVQPGPGSSPPVGGRHRHADDVQPPPVTVAAAAPRQLHLQWLHRPPPRPAPAAARFGARCRTGSRPSWAARPQRPPRHRLLLRKIVLRCLWTRRRSTRRSRNFSPPAPIGHRRGQGEASRDDRGPQEGRGARGSAELASVRTPRSSIGRSGRSPPSRRLGHLTAHGAHDRRPRTEGD